MEMESCRLLDLLILTEMVVFSLLVHDQVILSSENDPSAAQEPAESVGITEELLRKFDNMVISQETNTVN